jgi:hypothetical protein
VLRTVLTPDVRRALDRLLVPEVEGGTTTLTWLRRRAAADTPGELLEAIEKVEWLRARGVDGWDLSAVNPNRLKLLAGLGRRYTNQALQRAAPERRYPVLLALLQRTLREATDEAVDLFGACLAGVFARSKRALREHDLAVARSADEMVWLFELMGEMLMEPSMTIDLMRERVYGSVMPLEFAALVGNAKHVRHPKGRAFFNYLDTRYGYVRQFAPAFLDAVPLRSNRADDAVVMGVRLLMRLNRENRRRVPENAPTAFVQKRWRPFVFRQGGGSRPGSGKSAQIDRHGWELCLLSALRDRLRSGDVYTEPSARYADPESYLIPLAEWPARRAEACELLGLTPSGRERVAERSRELSHLLGHLDRELGGGHRGAPTAGVGDVRSEDGHLVVPPFAADELSASAAALAAAVTARLPRVDLADLLIEVDGWTGFTRHLTHAGGVIRRTSEEGSMDAERSGDEQQPDLWDSAAAEHQSLGHLRYLYAAVLAEACNVPLTEMAQSADLAYDRLRYAAHWHLREDTLSGAVAALVNYQYRQGLAALWGAGTLSSSDGQRFPVRGKARGATAVPRYFGYGRGITFYTWTSDQYSQYGTKVISTTVRDATYVLDEILDNETDLDVLERDYECGASRLSSRRAKAA